MLPLASRSALAVCAAGTLGMALAIAMRSPATAVMTGASFTALAVAFTLTLPRAARLRRQRLEFLWRAGPADTNPATGTVVAGSIVELHCEVRNHGARPVTLGWLTPIAPAHVIEWHPAPTRIAVPPRASTKFVFRFTPKACTRVVLQGIAATTPGPFGWFWAPLHFVSPLAIDVLPRAALRSAALVRRTAARVDAQSPLRGLAPVHRIGGGSDVRELREHRPGDPFKAIAWKATARTGKLIVREMEREAQETSYVVLDAGSSLRGGMPGARPLDHAIELAALAAREGLDHGDRVGLVTVDGRPLAHVPASDGPSQGARIHAGLIAATTVVDADLTETDDDAVAALVARHLHRNHATQLHGANLDALVSLAARALPHGARVDSIVAADHDHRVLRAYCAHRGITLPHRAATPPGAKAASLAVALRAAAGTSRTPRRILVISDFADMTALDTLAPTLAMLRTRGHSVAFLRVTETVVPHDALALPRTLHHHLAVLGVGLAEAPVGEPPTAALDRARAGRRVA